VIVRTLPESVHCAADTLRDADVVVGEKDLVVSVTSQEAGGQQVLLGIEPMGALWLTVQRKIDVVMCTMTPGWSLGWISRKKTVTSEFMKDRWEPSMKRMSPA
jgi:hypothetical protein